MLMNLINLQLSNYEYFFNISAFNRWYKAWVTANNHKWQPYFRKNVSVWNYSELQWFITNIKWWRNSNGIWKLCVYSRWAYTTNKIESATKPRNRFTALAPKQKMPWVQKITGRFLKDNSRRNHVLNFWLIFAFGHKRRREMDEIFLLFDVYFILIDQKFYQTCASYSMF